MTKEEVHELNKLVISAIAEVKYVANGACYSCFKFSSLYSGNRQDFTLNRCRKCNLKRIIQLRFGTTLEILKGKLAIKQLPPI